MKEITSSQDRVGKYKQKITKRTGKVKKKSLIKILALCASVGVVGVGLELGIIYGLKDQTHETIFEKRARYLEIANEQMLHAKTSEEINGLNSVIKDVENGVYDHAR